MSAAGGDLSETVEVTLRAVGPSRPTTLRLPPLLSVAELRGCIARERRLAGTEEVRLRLILRGKTLPHQDDSHVTLRDGGGCPKSEPLMSSLAMCEICS